MNGADSYKLLETFDIKLVSFSFKNVSLSRIFLCFRATISDLTSIWFNNVHFNADNGTNGFLACGQLIVEWQPQWTGYRAENISVTSPSTPRKHKMTEHLHLVNVVLRDIA